MPEEQCMKDTVMPNVFVTPASLKILTLATADLREESYDPDTRKYRLHIDEASELACQLLGEDKDFARIVALALDSWWNDAMDWAGDQKGREAAARIPEGYEYPSHGPFDPVVLPNEGLSKRPARSHRFPLGGSEGEGEN